MFKVRELVGHRQSPPVGMQYDFTVSLGNWNRALTAFGPDAFSWHYTNIARIEKAIETKEDYILPARFDDTETAFGRLLATWTFDASPGSSLLL